MSIPYWFYLDTWSLIKVETNGYYMSAEHLHDHHELSFNLSNIPVLHTISGHQYTTDTPFIVYRAPYTLHSSTTLTDDIYLRYKLDINTNLFTVYDGIISMGTLQNTNECIIPTTNEQMKPIESLLGMLSEYTRGERSNPLNNTCIGILAAIFGKINELADNTLVRHVNTQQYIQEVIYYIVNHISDNLTADTLSRIFFVSRTKLYNDFRLVTNLSLHEYITAVRISLAKTWIMQGVPLSQLPERCGFNQASSFIVMFKRITGMTPGEYYEQVKGCW